jgi:hypothetical protein
MTIAADGCHRVWLTIRCRAFRSPEPCQLLRSGPACHRGDRVTAEQHKTRSANRTRAVSVQLTKVNRGQEGSFTDHCSRRSAALRAGFHLFPKLVVRLRFPCPAQCRPGGDRLGALAGMVRKRPVDDEVPSLSLDAVRDFRFAADADAEVGGVAGGRPSVRRSSGRRGR